MAGRRPCGVLALALVAACDGGRGWVTFDPVAVARQPVGARSAEQVLVAHDSAVPEALRTLAVVGELEAASSLHSPVTAAEDELLPGLREIAGRHGCVAIIVSPIREKTVFMIKGAVARRAFQTARCLSSNPPATER